MYPLTPVPSAMCHLERAICKIDKSTLLKILQKNIVSNPASCDIMTEVPLSFGNISQRLISVVTFLNAHTGTIAFDRYFTPSIKDYSH